MIKQKILLTASAFCLVLLSQGCFFKKFGTSEKYNVLGAITHEKQSYSPVEVGSLHLSSEEVVSRQNFSGTKRPFCGVYLHLLTINQICPKNIILQSN